MAHMGKWELYIELRFCILRRKYSLEVPAIDGRMIMKSVLNEFVVNT
jgi:hypothetical protein